MNKCYTGGAGMVSRTKTLQGVEMDGESHDNQPERGCGTRVFDGIYIVTDANGGGSILDWLIDPTEPFPYQDIGLTPRGVIPIERDGVTHVVDWVGKRDYPNVADFVEEAMRFGISRRIPKTFDFSLLTAESRLILVHHKAFLYDTTPFINLAVLNGLFGRETMCPCGRLDHDWMAWGALIDQEPDALPDCCAGVWWMELDDGTPAQPPFTPELRAVKRDLPSFSYQGWSIGGMHAHVPAAFASVPIGQIEIVRGQSDAVTDDLCNRATESDIPVEVVGVRG